MFNRIAVEFVPEGVTAEEARRAREGQRKTLSKRDAVVALLAVAALVGIVAIPAWKFWPRQTIPPTPAPPVVAAAPAIPPASTPIAPTPLPTSIITPTNTIPPPTPTMAVVTVTTVSRFFTVARSLRSSPIATPAPTVVPVTAVITQAVVITTHPLTISAPLSPLTPTYRVLLNAIHAEGNPGASSHISGWIVERDGHTPRPVRMALDFPTGSMAWPRPGMTDVANGYYEFLVEPGDYTLRVLGDEPFALPVVISPTGPARYEISIQYNGERAIAAAPLSVPWDNDRAPHPSAASSPTLTPTPTPKISSVYLPLILRRPTAVEHQIAAGEHKIFLPLVSKSGVLTGSLQIRDLVNY